MLDDWLQVPYDDVHYLTVAYSVGINGCTLPIPATCPKLFRDLITSCWFDSNKRPTFGDIVDRINHDVSKQLLLN